MARAFLLSLLLVGMFSAASVLAQDSSARLVADTAQLRKFDAYEDFIRRRNTRDYAITTPNRIDEGKYVLIGGIEQWITIRGADRRNPVVLFLHGGPGDVTNPWGYAVFRPWLKQFTVVQWDERGASRTLGRNGPSIASTISFDRMVQDGIEVAELVRTELKQDRVILVGHSFGSLLGLHMVKARPDLFAAYIGTGQVADETRQHRVAYQELLAAARRRGEQAAVLELEQVGPPPWSDGQGYGVEHKWANFFEHADVFLGSTVGLSLVAPGYTLKDVVDDFDGQVLSADRLVPHTLPEDMPSLGGSFTVPVFVIQGAEDFTTPTSLARELVASIRAPRKAFVAVEGAGHFAVFMKPDVFLSEMTTLLSPILKAR